MTGPLRARVARGKGSLLDFGLRVVSGFNGSQGLLLSGAVAYYTLLSIVPLVMVLLVGLSHATDERRLLGAGPASLRERAPRLSPPSRWMRDATGA